MRALEFGVKLKPKFRLSLGMRGPDEIQRCYTIEEARAVRDEWGQGIDRYRCGPHGEAIRESYCEIFRVTAERVE